MVFCNSDTTKDWQSLMMSHNPYFNRWFSAIKGVIKMGNQLRRHNPYFNRWFSAIYVLVKNSGLLIQSQSLF